MCGIGNVLTSVLGIGGAAMKAKGERKQLEEERRAFEAKMALRDAAVQKQQQMVMTALPDLGAMPQFQAGGAYDQAAQRQEQGMTADLAKLQDTSMGEAANGKVSDAYAQARADASARAMTAAIKDARLAARANAGGQVLQGNQQRMAQLNSDMQGAMSDANAAAAKIQPNAKVGAKTALAGAFMSGF